MYENAKYVNGMHGELNCIVVIINDAEWSVPLDPANTDYANIMALVAAGELTIAPAESV